MKRIDCKSNIDIKLHKAFKTIASSFNEGEKGNTFITEVSNLFDKIENPDSYQKTAIEFFKKHALEN